MTRDAVVDHERRSASDGAEWIQATLQRSMAGCVRVVRAYVPVRRHPTVTVVADAGQLDELNGRPLPEWVRALTVRDAIFFLDRGQRWTGTAVRRVLCHELFHAAAWLHLRGRVVLPWWFSEGAADWIVKREFGLDAPSYFSRPGPRERGPAASIERVTERGRLAERFCGHLLRAHQPGDLRKTLAAAGRLGDVDRAARSILGFPAQPSEAAAASRRSPRAS